MSATQRPLQRVKPPPVFHHNHRKLLYLCRIWILTHLNSIWEQGLTANESLERWVTVQLRSSQGRQQCSFKTNTQKLEVITVQLKKISELQAMTVQFSRQVFHASDISPHLHHQTWVYSSFPSLHLCFTDEMISSSVLFYDWGINLSQFIQMHEKKQDIHHMWQRILAFFTWIFC